MRRSININENWRFRLPGQDAQQVNIPHTWNHLDGQDGGNDYLRTTAVYEKTFPMPDFCPENEQVYLDFAGVNSEAEVILNGQLITCHEGGYSTFRGEITHFLQAENTLTVRVNNAKNQQVYPQKADFTFYGGIYRDVQILIVHKHHFDVEYFGTPGLQITAQPTDDYKNAQVQVKSWHTAPEGQVQIRILDAQGEEVASGAGTDATLTISNVHLWNGIRDPYLYTAQLQLVADGQVTDAISSTFGVRDFAADPQKGFFLNGQPYPLRGVCRHQDRKGLGNAISKEMHDEDMALIREIGANTIRLAHYQHDQYFYDLCDKYGMIVWAEIPYISEHMPSGRANTISQMKELIVQNYNHPSIVTWGISNEITISTKNTRDMLDNHHVLNDLCHKMDPSRLTTLACYAVCGPFNKVAHISDIVSWNLYLGWYVPGLFLNDLWVDFFHKVYPKRCLGYSEYGAEGMPNLHSAHPRRGDHTEEYQALYHEYLLKFIEKRPWMWATHVWNMFDFAADARNQGGEPGMNHKGLVTFDRKTKKDSFYLYKSYWNPEPMVHICSKRFADRTTDTITVKVYSNQRVVNLYCNDVLVATKQGKHVFSFEVPLEEQAHISAVAGNCRDTATFRRVSKPNASYKLRKTKKNSQNWV